MPRNSGFGLHSRIVTGAILVVSMSGCASNVRVAGFGDLPAVDQVKGYRIAANTDGKHDQQPALLTSALSSALARKGLAVDANSEKSIEVGFAIRSPRVTLENGLATAHAFRPFCKRQLYILSLVASDRQSGEILAERQASAMRCSWTTSEAVTRLTDAAINQRLLEKFRTVLPQAPRAAK